jgi:hypothetical protein
MVIIIKKNKYLKKSHVISLDETLMEKWLSDLTGFTKLELNHFISNETFQHFIYLEELYIWHVFFSLRPLFFFLNKNRSANII